MVTRKKPRLLRLQKSSKESTWGIGPGFTSTSPEEQRKSRIRVRLKAMKIGRLERPEQRVKGAGFWGR